MPLRDDLLRPISEESPAGIDLTYDKVFDQIKEARTEDDESLPTGNWSRPLKRADRPLVVRLSGEALATRSKDLRLAGWYGEALLRCESFLLLTPILEVLHRLQEQFWERLYPLQEADGDLGRRAGALESAGTQLATQLKLLPLTRTGVNYVQAQDARALGYERDQTTPENKAHYQDALQRGRLVLEELDKAVADTPKAFYAETDRALGDALGAIEALDEFHGERYADDPPSFVRLKTAISDVRRFVAGVLTEKRKLEPDPAPEMAAETAPTVVLDPFSRFDQGVLRVAPVDDSRGGVEHGSSGEEVQQLGHASMELMSTAVVAASPLSLSSPEASPNTRQAALAQIAGIVRFLVQEGTALETAYALAAAPGVAVLFRAKFDEAWPAPATGVRQTLRKLAREEKWAALERAGLEAMASNPEMVWLDLHRYVWQAAAELGHVALTASVIATVLGCLRHLPELGKAVLEDDTPMASMETQSWLRALQPELAGENSLAADRVSAEVFATFGRGSADRSKRGGPATDTFTDALQMVKQGRAAEAISLLYSEAEQQPSGRLRFERRLQTAELCLQTGHAAVAHPLLVDLTAELERRTLEGWESASLLGKPLALMIRCLDQGVSASENRNTLFARLCRLDPVAAAGLNGDKPGKAG